MKRFSAVSFLCCFSISLFCLGLYDAAPEDRSSTVVVYTYDSFAAEWGAAPVLQALFKEETGLNVVFISAGDGAQVLSKAAAEKNKPQADVLLGIDNNQYAAAKQLGVLVPYAATGIEAIPTDRYFEPNVSQAILTPFDWSTFAFMYDSSDSVFATAGVPHSLEDLANPAFAKKIVILDPRLSTPGLGLFAWVQDVYKDKADDYWKRIKRNILTMAPSWDTGYGMFTSGEAPIVISYTTSAPYHEMAENTTRFKAAVFTDGHISQVEGAGLVRNCLNPEGAKKFLDFLISPRAQQELFVTQWMYPVSPNVTVPEAFMHCAENVHVRTSVAPVTTEQIEHVLSILAE